MKEFLKPIIASFINPNTKKIRPSKWVALIFFMLLTLVPIHQMATENTWLVKLILTTNIFAIFAISWDILSGYTGQENFGHHFFVGVGGFMVGLFTVALVKPGVVEGATQAALVNVNIPGGILILISGVLAAFFGLLIGVPCLKLSGPYLALATISMGLIFYEFVDKILPGLHPVIKSHATESIRGLPSLVSSPILFYYIVLIVTIISLLVLYSYSRSNYGFVLKAIKKDEPAAKAMSINTTFYKVTVFMVSAFFAGIAGAFLAYSLGSIAGADIQTNLGIKIISMCIVGGIGTISGSFGGSYFLMILLWSMNEIARLLSDITGIDGIVTFYKIFEDIFYFGAIVLVLLFMPHGILTSVINKFNARYLKKKSTELW